MGQWWKRYDHKTCFLSVGWIDHLLLQISTALMLCFCWHKSTRYFGTTLWLAWKVEWHSLYVICPSTFSQCRLSWSKGVTWSYFNPSHMIFTVALSTLCRLSTADICDPARRQFQRSTRDTTKLFTSVFADSVGRAWWQLFMRPNWLTSWLIRASIERLPASRGCQQSEHQGLWWQLTVWWLSSRVMVKGQVNAVFNWCRTRE